MRNPAGLSGGRFGMKWAVGTGPQSQALTARTTRDPCNPSVDRIEGPLTDHRDPFQELPRETLEEVQGGEMAEALGTALQLFVFPK